MGRDVKCIILARTLHGTSLHMWKDDMLVNFQEMGLRMWTGSFEYHIDYWLLKIDFTELCRLIKLLDELFDIYHASWKYNYVMPLLPYECH